MAIVIKKGNTLHIQWYDPIKKKTNSKTTGLKATIENERKAEKYAKQLQTELSKEGKKIKSNFLRESTISEAFDHFLEINKNKKQKTIMDYKRFYGYFKNFFNAEDPVSKITKNSYEAWLNEIKSLNLQKNSIHAIGKQGNHFINFLFEYDYIDVFKVNKNVKTRPEVKRIVTFSDDQVKAIFSNLKSKKDNFQTLVYALYYTGIRSKDLLTINVENINFDKKTLEFYNNKDKSNTSHWNEVPIHPGLIDLLKARTEKIKTGKLFAFRDEDAISQAVRVYLEEIGIYKLGLSARTFRKTFMTKLREKGVDQSIVQKLVGHSPGSVMDRHYNNISVDTLKNAIKKLPKPPK